MSRSSTLMLMGILTILVPFSGLPSSMRTVLSVAFGAVVVSIAAAERARVQKARLRPPTTPAPAQDSAADTLEPAHTQSAF